MTTMNANGRGERKSLAGQLDRLDTILDGLADGLNEAVAQTVKEAVVVAVNAAVRELLASAELQRRLRPEPMARPGLVRRVASTLCRGVVSVAQGCRSWISKVTERGRNKATEVVSALRESRKTVVASLRGGLTAFARRVWFGRFVALGLVSPGPPPAPGPGNLGSQGRPRCESGRRPRRGVWPGRSRSRAARPRRPGGCSRV